MLDISADDIYLPLGSVDIDSSSHDGVQTQMDCVAMHNSDKYAPLNIFMANECQYWIDCHRFKKNKTAPFDVEVHVYYISSGRDHVLLSAHLVPTRKLFPSIFYCFLLLFK